MDFSDYIIYADETGDPSLTSIDAAYPIFGLVFCVIKKVEYRIAVEAMLKFKFDVFGHDMVVLHDREIRKATGEFSFLAGDQVGHRKFMAGVGDVVAQSPFCLIAAVIEKNRLAGQYFFPDNPYDLALKFCLERAHMHIGNAGTTTHVIVESRGKSENDTLELAFRRICDGDNYDGLKLPFAIRFSDKRVNSTGLQLADLVARPIGQRVLRPASSSRAYEVIEPKFRCGPGGRISGFGLKVFP